MSHNWPLKTNVPLISDLGGSISNSIAVQSKENNQNNEDDENNTLFAKKPENKNEIKKPVKQKKILTYEQV